MISFISMFSGIEAASVAFKPLGWKAICFAEIEKFPAAVLAHHYPDVPNVGDMSKHDWAQYRGKVDIVCGGPPCQAFSVAGLRGSLDDARGNLSLTYMKALHAINPRNAIVENVPGWLSTKDNAFGCFLAGLVGADDALPPPDGKRWPSAGMVSGPKGRAAWRVLDAQYFGLSQRRKRVIVVADFGNGADPAAVLFEPESVRRDSPPSRETGQGSTSPVESSLAGGSRHNSHWNGGVHPPLSQGSQTRAGSIGASNQEIFEQGGAGLVPSYTPEVARCDTTREGQSQDFESTTMLVQSVTGQISHALKAEGADASEDGTGRGTPIICFSAKDYGADATLELNPTLRAGGHTSSHANAGVMPAICQTVALRGRDGGATAELGDDVAFALRSSSGGGDKPYVLAFDQYNYKTDNIAASLTSGQGTAQHNTVLTSAVRRLTPRECERLQGFQWQCSPDYPGAWADETGRYWSPDYTSISYGNISKAKLDADYIKYLARGNPKNMTRADVAGLASDGPRYKSLGNSWAVPKFHWLGARLDRALTAQTDPLALAIERYRAQRRVLAELLAAA